MRLLLIGYFVVLAAFSCEGIKNSNGGEAGDDTIKHGLVKKYRDDGSLLSESNYDSGILNGLARNYYADGKIKSEFNYVQGKKEGVVTMYYESGEKYRETEYENNIREGTVTVFHKNGKIASKTPYHEDFPGIGLEEYLSNGNLKENYPDLKIEAIDNLNSKGEYLLKIYFTKERKRAEYFEGELTNGKFMNDQLLKLETNDGYAYMRFAPPAPGTFTMRKLNIVGNMKTPNGNSYIVVKPYNLAIDY